MTYQLPADITMIKKTLLELCLDILTDDARHWFVQCIQSLEASDKSIDDVCLYSAMVIRKTCLCHVRNLTEEICYRQLLQCYNHWQLADIVRITLIVVALDVATDQSGHHHESIKKIYQFGDELEKATILKGLSLLDPNGSCMDLAIDAGRTNSLLLFSAIALNNPYPQNHYSQSSFNQLVLKSLFLKLDISDIVGLWELRNDDLSRMCCDYLNELLAAERHLPVAIFLGILAKDIDAVNILAQYIGDVNPQYRYYAGLSLQKYSGTIPMGCLQAAAKQMTIENQGNVKSMLMDIVNNDRSSLTLVN